MVELEWQEEKRLQTLRERNLNFEDADQFFDGRPVVHERTPRHGEERWKSIAQMGERIYTLVWMWRDERIRVISMRRSHDKEERRYRALYNG